MLVPCSIESIARCFNEIKFDPCLVGHGHCPFHTPAESIGPQRRLYRVSGNRKYTVPVK